MRPYMHANGGLCRPDCPEFRSRPCENCGAAQRSERRHTVERALPDCEVILHKPWTLPRVVLRGERSYIDLPIRPWLRGEVFEPMSTNT